MCSHGRPRDGASDALPPSRSIAGNQQLSCKQRQVRHEIRVRSVTPLRLREFMCVCVCACRCECEWVRKISAHDLCVFLSLLLSDFLYPCLWFSRSAIVSCWRVTSCLDYFGALGSCSVVLNRMAAEEVLLVNTETNYWDLMISWDQPICIFDCIILPVFAASTSR